jgi:type II secretory pathway pseudopilin PulG
MFKNKKIKSFTIVEMLVVMILTIIVISIAVLVLNLIQKELKGIQLNYKNNTEIKTLELALWNDFNKNTISFDTKTHQLICENPLDTVFYKFSKNYVIRNKDTLKVKVTENNYYLDMDKSIMAVDAIDLKFSKEFQNKKLFIFKKKASSYYMNK